MKYDVDVVLIHPCSRTEVYQSLGNRLSAIEPPVWIGMLAGFLRNRGYSVSVVEGEAENLSPEETAHWVHERNPVLAVMVVYGHQPSASTQVMTSAGLACTAIKQLYPEIKVLMVGGHVAALPERTLREESVDFVCGGEGFHTIATLVDVLKAGSEDFDAVPDLFYWKEGALCTTRHAPLVRNLDAEIPALAWDLLPMKKYRAHNWHCFGYPSRQPYASLYTTLGCPFKCTFCCIQAPFKSGEKELGYKESVNSYRFWSPEWVIRQLELLATTYGVTHVKFADEMFVLNERHVVGICDRIVDRGLDLNIWAYTRVDTVKERMVERMKRAGINWLVMGIEAGHERVRNDVFKAFDQFDVFKAVALLRSGGVNVLGNYIFGLPEDDHETMQATLDLAIELNTEFANFYSAMAYPGSSLYTFALKMGWPLPKRWSGFSQHAVDTLPLPTKYLSGPEVLRFRDRAFQIYFTNPRYLALVNEKFGPDVLAQIQEMVAHKLKRAYA